MLRHTRFALPVTLMLLPLGCFSPNDEIDSETSSETDGAATVGMSGGSTGDTATTSGASATSEASETGGSTTTDRDDTTSGNPPRGTTTQDETGTTDPIDPPPGCGNGELDGDEECDEGRDNGAGECTELCTIAFCGDAVISLDEMCDDGDENGTELGDCAPDCSKLVDTKIIATSFDGGDPTTGNLGPDPIATVDAICASAGLPGYRAMFADGVNRRATVTPYSGDSQVDWVLTPWTRYTRETGELVWVTDQSALLGVTGGRPAPLLAPIRATAIAVRTGLRGNWVAETVQDCSNWTSASASSPATFGAADEVELGEVLAGISNFCDIGLPVYCVEQ